MNINTKRWLQREVKFWHFLKGLRMGAVIDRFRNFRAGAADFDEDDQDNAGSGVRVDLDKVLDELNPFGWFQVRGLPLSTSTRRGLRVLGGCPKS